MEGTASASDSLNVSSGPGIRCVHFVSWQTPVRTACRRKERAFAYILRTHFGNFDNGSGGTEGMNCKLTILPMVLVLVGVGATTVHAQNEVTT